MTYRGISDYFLKLNVAFFSHWRLEAHIPLNDIPVTETQSQTNTEMIDISKTHTKTNTEKIFNTDTIYI